MAEKRRVRESVRTILNRKPNEKPLVIFYSLILLKKQIKLIDYFISWHLGKPRRQFIPRSVEPGKILGEESDIKKILLYIAELRELHLTGCW